MVYTSSPAAIAKINSSDAGDGIFQLWEVNTTPVDALAP